MPTPGPAPSITLADTLQVFDARTDPAEPLTASEVAAELDCTRRTAHKKLEALAERGDLQSKKPGARSRVWWRPSDSHDGSEVSEDARKVTQVEDLADQVAEYAIFVLDDDGHVESWNAGAEQTKGYTADEIIGEHFSTFYTESDRRQDRPARNLRAAAELGEVEDEGWRVRKDGSRFWASVTITRLTDDTGDASGYVKVTRDMTDRHTRTLELKREKERFESLVTEVTDYAIFMLDEAGYVESWNAGAEHIKGYTADEIIGEHFSTFYTPSDRDTGLPERNLETAATEGRVEDEGWRVRKDGSRFWANVVITRLTNDDGSTRGFAKVTRDMTERRRYEQQLKRQRDELDELNRISAVIRDVDQVLVSAEDRPSLETAVCDRLTDSEPYVAAWFVDTAEPAASGAEPETVLDALQINAAAGLDVASIQGLPVDATDASTPRTAGEPSEPLDDGAFDDGALERRIVRDALDTAEVQVAEPDAADRPAHWTEATFDQVPSGVAAIPLLADEFVFGVLLVYSAASGAFDDRKLAVLSQLGETISDTFVSMRRHEREQRLTALHHATRDLVQTEDATELGAVVTETVTSVLGFQDAHLYELQTDDNTLQPIASAGVAGNSVRLPALGAGDDSVVWSSFVDGETRTITQPSETATSAGTGDRAEVVVPLSEHGVLVASREPGVGVAADDRQLVELVAATAEAAFDRLESEANLRERDAILQEQNQRLQRLNQVNTLIREVDQALVQATTFEEIQRVVCERLTTTDRFRFAWIGAVHDTDGGLEPAATGGIQTDYLDAAPLDGDSAEPAIVAAQTGTVQVVENVADDLRAAPWRSEAFSRELQSCIAVPLTYGDVTYGVLAVYGDRPGTFADIEESVFDELGTTIGNALHAVETKHALLSDRTVEVEFLIGDPDATVLTTIAHQTDAEITYEGTIPTSADGIRLFFSATGVDTDTILDAATDHDSVSDATVVAEHDTGALYEIELSEDAIATALANQNASLTEFTVGPEEATLLVDVPASSDVGEFIDWFLASYPNATFVARRERDRTVDSPEQFRTELTDHLTDRQYEVLKTAYISGFFDSPRQSTGSDVADTLDVSQPTVTEHLRAAQRRILDHLFED